MINGWRDLESEQEFQELLETMGYIEKENANDQKFVKELCDIIESKLTRKNLLVLLCQVEKITLPWMLVQLTEGAD